MNDMQPRMYAPGSVLRAALLLQRLLLSAAHAALIPALCTALDDKPPVRCHMYTYAATSLALMAAAGPTAMATGEAYSVALSSLAGT